VAAQGPFLADVDQQVLEVQVPPARGARAGGR
jgi:hypothetical protein